MGVIDLAREREDRQPHMEGASRCTACSHEFHSVIPSAAFRDNPWFECPSCHTMRATFKHSVLRPGGRWVCKCGSELFALHESGPYCPSCGLWVSGYEPTKSFKPV